MAGGARKSKSNTTKSRNALPASSANDAQYYIHCKNVKFVSMRRFFFDRNPALCKRSMFRDYEWSALQANENIVINEVD